MTTPVYQLFIGKNSVAANMASKAMSKEENDLLWKQMSDSYAEFESENILVCDSAFANEETPFWGVNRSASLQAHINRTQRMKEIGWLDRIEAFTLLGTLIDEKFDPLTITNPLYQLWVAKSSSAATQAMSTLQEGLNELLWQKHHALMHECGAQTLMICDTHWSNEAYQYFGVDAYPDVEAVISIRKGLDALGWMRYFESFSILGKSWQR